MINESNSRIEYCIDAKAYEQILNNVRFKAPLEAGIEVAVYMLLYGVLDSTKYDLVDVSTMTKRNFCVYLSESGRNNASENNNSKADKTTDLVIVGKNFNFNAGNSCESNESGAYAFIEVKSLTIKKYEKEVDIQKGNIDHFIWTNGLKWVFINKNSEEIIDLDKRKRFPKQYNVDEESFKELLIKLNSIEWDH